MTLVEIKDFLSQQAGEDTLLDDATLMFIINEIQKFAFTKDIFPFLKFEDINLDYDEGDGLTYALPTDCRKLLGVTFYTDRQIYNGSTNGCQPLDYGMNVNTFNPQTFYVPGRIDILRRTFKFIDDPNPDKTYRFHYYLRPEEITDLEEDDDKLLIPSEYHSSLIIEAATAYAAKTIYGEPISIPEFLAPYMDNFWSALGTLPGDAGDVNSQSYPAF